MGKRKGRTKREWTRIDEAHHEWIVTGVERFKISRKAFGDALGRSEGTASKIITGKRPLDYGAGEVGKIAKLFGPSHPPPNGMMGETGETIETPVPPSAGLRVEAIIAPGYWGEATATMTVVPQLPISGRLEPKFAGMQQYLCALRADPNVYYICAPFAAMRAAPLADEEIHVRRTRQNGEHEDTIRLVRITERKVTLVLVKPDGNIDDSDILDYPSRANETLELRGLVLARVTTKNV